MSARRVFLGLLVSVYGLLMYRLCENALLVDFSSFYAASQALIQDHNPYKLLFTTYLEIPRVINNNLNPPILLLLFYPFTCFGYYVGFWFWSFFSLVLGAGAAFITCKIVFPEEIFKKYYVYFIVLSLAFFPSLINLGIAQLGGVIAFCMMLGYYCYLKRNDVGAAIMWGMIIASKLFPGLLFLYVLKMRRYRLLWMMGSVVLILFLIPMWLYGFEIYPQYFSILPKVNWYGDNWNASLYGFLFRLMVDINVGLDRVVWVSLVHTFLLGLGALGYLLLKEPSNQSETHSSFCLILVLMLLFSPFAWLYFLPLVLFPLTVVFWRLVTRPLPLSTMMSWLVCLFLINFPLDHISTKHMGALWVKVSLYSCPFYGLLLLGYLGHMSSFSAATIPSSTGCTLAKSDTVQYLALPTMIILSLGLVSGACRLMKVV